MPQKKEIPSSSLFGVENIQNTSKTFSLMSPLSISFSKASKDFFVSISFRGKDEKFRMTNLEWGVDFFSMTNLVKTSSVGQI